MIMKRIVYSIMAMTMIFASCQKENIKEDVKTPEAESENAREVLFTAEIMQTKTVLHGTKVMWTDGDQIGVSGADSAMTATLPAPSVTATFAGTAVPDAQGRYFAVYPYSALDQKTPWTESVANLKLPVNQTALEGSFAEELNITAAATDGKSMNLKFHNLLGYMKFDITEASGKIMGMTITAIGGEKLSGAFTVDCTKPVAVAAASGSYSSVNIFSSTPLAAGSYYVAMLPGTYSKGLKIEFFGEDGRTAVKSVEKPLTLNAGTINPIGSVPALAWGNDVLRFECEYGTLSGTKIENHDIAFGTAVNLKNGSITMKVNIPEEGAYRFEANYLTWGAGQKKVNKAAIDGLMSTKDINFVGNDKFSLITLGDVVLPAGEVTVVLSSSWGWTIFDYVKFTKICYAGFEAESGTVYSEAVVADQAGAFGGKVVNIKGSGSFDTPFTVQEDGKYELRMRYWSNDKYEFTEVPGFFKKTVYDYTGNGWLVKTYGVFDLKAGQTYSFKASNNWGWSYWDKIMLVKTDRDMLVAECEDGVLGGDAGVDTPSPSDAYGTAVRINDSGSITVNMNVPKAGNYQLSIRYFNWSGQDKIENVEVPGYMDVKNFTFRGFQNYAIQDIAVLNLAAGTVSVKISKNHGWSYFDRVILTECDY